MKSFKRKLFSHTCMLMLLLLVFTSAPNIADTSTFSFDGNGTHKDHTIF